MAPAARFLIDGGSGGVPLWFAGRSETRGVDCLPSSRNAKWAWAVAGSGVDQNKCSLPAIGRGYVCDGATAGPPMLTIAGMVVSVLLLPSGVVRIPSTLTYSGKARSNSMVPRLPPRDRVLRRDHKRIVHAATIASAAVPIWAPVSSRMITPMFPACAETFSTATPSTKPLVLSKAKR